MTTTKYKKALEEMIQEFAIKYYEYEKWEYKLSEYETIHHLEPIEIADDYWSVEDIRIALESWINAKELMERYYSRIEEEHTINLLSRTMWARPENGKEMLEKKIKKQKELIAKEKEYMDRLIYELSDLEINVSRYANKNRNTKIKRKSS